MNSSAWILEDQKNCSPDITPNTLTPGALKLHWLSPGCEFSHRSVTERRTSHCGMSQFDSSRQTECKMNTVAFHKSLLRSGVLDGLSTVSQEMISTVMEPPGDTGPVLVAAPGQPVWQPWGCHSRIKCSHHLQYLSSSNICWVFWSHLKQGDLHNLFSKYLEKGQKHLQGYFAQQRVENYHKQSSACRGREGRLGRFLHPPWGLGQTGTRLWGALCHQLRAQRAPEPPTHEGIGHGQMLLVRWLIPRSLGARVLKDIIMH